MKKIHYAWVVCLAGSLMQFCSIGLAANIFSVYQPYIIRLNQFTNTQGSMLVTVRTLISILVLFVIDKYYEKLELRLGTALSIGSIAAAYFLFGAARNYAMYLAASMLAGVGYSMGAMIPCSILVSRWFKSRQALALSICSAGTGAATVLMPPAVTGLIEKIGLSGTFIMEGILVSIITVVLFLLIRNDPADCNLECFQVEAGETHTASAGCLHAHKRGDYYSVMLVVFLLGGCGSNAFTHMGVLFQSENYSAMQIAAITSALGLLLTLGKCLYGWTNDRVGTSRSNSIFGILLIMGMLSLDFSFLHLPGILLPGILAVGLGFPLINIGLSLWASDLVEPERYQHAIKSFQISFTSGTMLFSVLPGITADLFHSYIPIYAFFTAMLLLAVILLQKVYLKI